MELIEASLIERIARTATTESFRFRPRERLSFAPGQFVQLLFDPGNGHNKELNKYISLSSSPEREYIEITKRLSESLFSRKLKGLQAGDNVLFSPPMGNCIFREGYGKIGFLIGGIGITPAISIIEYIIDKGLHTDICLAYSSRTEEEIAFKKELDQWAAINKNIKVGYAVTDCQPKDKTCVFGRINGEWIRQRMCDIAGRIIFIFGPPKMVEAMNAVAVGEGAKAENIRKENFVGY
jgi:nitric oxide dioxygenase